ncbi:RNA polymerase I-specific transcription initiation factor-like protein rrn7 [Cadophora sp. MPI-SDFR-AT-0126]|nr:RNA polymerase I-specific transcription initiation factor-like protein rrn7 [Leotiomycetes sp. MPI-SDFR-AT-0126]
MSSHIEYQRFRRGESCTEEGCRARKFYIEDGKKFCQRGHEQAGFTQTQQDEDDWNTQGKKSRKKREERQRVETILSGGEAKELYLQCYQLILRKQCHWLVTTLGLPEELQIIVRDLWELRLRILHFPRDERSGYGSGTGTMLFSSASEGNNTDIDGMTHRSTGSRMSRKSAVMEEKLPKLIETLALCYLGTLLLKLPVSVGDFHKWAVQDRIVYNRAIKEVPKEMRSKLPAHFHAALEIRAPLDGAKLHSSIAQLAEFYNLEFDMELPRLNVTLLVFRYMKELCLPVELYPAIRRLESLLQMDFAYPTAKTARKGTGHPEVQLVSLIAIATKLAYPFDKVNRTPDSYFDPSTVKLDWSQWLKTTAQEKLRGLARGEAIQVTDTDVWDLNTKKMDDYLDWYQNTWIDDRDPKSKY